MNAKGKSVEPRVLLLADFPAIAPLFSGDISQLENKLDNFLSYDLLNTALPVITLSEQIDAKTLISFAPTIDELLAIDISKGYANSGTVPVINWDGENSLNPHPIIKSLFVPMLQWNLAQAVELARLALETPFATS